jgi:hypothetical protein
VRRMVLLSSMTSTFNPDRRNFSAVAPFIMNTSAHQLVTHGTYVPRHCSLQRSVPLLTY